MIRIVLPAHLRTLARVNGEVKLHVEGRVTQRSVLDALETRYPTLRGTIRDHVTQERRPLVRFFACAQDLSHEPPDAPLPHEVAMGTEPFLIVGAIAGGEEPAEQGRIPSIRGGRIGIESRLGSGTTVAVWLPSADAPHP